MQYTIPIEKAFLMNLTSKLLSPLCVCYTQVCGENKSTKAVVEILSLNEIFIGKLQRYISHAVAAFSIQFNKVLINSCQIDFCLSRTESKLDTLDLVLSHQ